MSVALSFPLHTGPRFANFFFCTYGMCLVLFQSGLGEDLLRVEQPEALPPCAVPDDHPTTVRVHVGVRAAPLTVGLGLHSLEK